MFYAETRVYQILWVIAFGLALAPHLVAFIWTEAYLEFLYDIVAEAAMTEIGKTDCAPIDGLMELVLKPVVGPLVDHKQTLTLALLSLLLV